jgi:hypothetical protein
MSIPISPRLQTLRGLMMVLAIYREADCGSFGGLDRCRGLGGLKG